jgi:hypothetical protein
MRKLTLIVFALSLLACSKTNRVSGRISGSWELISYKRTNYEGMISYPSASGSATFIELKNPDDSATYTFEIAREINSVSDSLLEKGTYKLVEKGNFMYVNEQDNLDQTISYIKYRILSSTNSDLEIEFSKGTNTDILLFRKN